MTMVSCRYFIRGETACKKVARADSGVVTFVGLKEKPRTYVIIVDGVWRQADVLDVPPQLRLHLREKREKKEI